jgi:hypothetical protein
MLLHGGSALHVCACMFPLSIFWALSNPRNISSRSVRTLRRVIRRWWQGVPQGGVGALVCVVIRIRRTGSSIYHLGLCFILVGNYVHRLETLCSSRSKRDRLSFFVWLRGWVWVNTGKQRVYVFAVGRLFGSCALVLIVCLFVLLSCRWARCERAITSKQKLNGTMLSTLGK